RWKPLFQTPASEANHKIETTPGARKMMTHPTHWKVGVFGCFVRVFGNGSFQVKSKSKGWTDLDSSQSCEQMAQIRETVCS
ncbi:hypothetical protein, partial [uncultured Sphingorhabdus sp.]|uniref:hypothetical protein n=1 Tax=uncultured Sphingorhabdus sp. TaxID=1686106 RepID=UPI00262DE138